MKIYQIVQGGNLAELQEKVEELLVEGYVPTGGVSQVASRYIQAVYQPALSALFVPGAVELAKDPPSIMPHGTGNPILDPDKSIG